MTFPASPELFLEIISPCSSNRSHSGGPQPSALDLQTQYRHSHSQGTELALLPIRNQRTFFGNAHSYVIKPRESFS